MLLLGPAEAEIGDEFVIRRRSEVGGEPKGIEDRDPAEAEAARPRGEPDHGDHRGDGIVERLRHGSGAEPVALPAAVVAEHGVLRRRRVEPRELQPRIGARAGLVLRGEGLGVAGLEIAAHRRALARRGDLDPAPRLAVADRGRKLRQRQYVLEQRARHGIAPKAPHVTPPRDQLVELIAEGFVELRRHGGLRR